MTTQRQKLIDAENQLGVGPTKMAAELGVPYDTYKNWRSERRSIPAVGWKCLELVLKFSEETT